MTYEYSTIEQTIMESITPLLLMYNEQISIDVAPLTKETIDRLHSQYCLLSPLPLNVLEFDDKIMILLLVCFREHSDREKARLFCHQLNNNTILLPSKSLQLIQHHIHVVGIKKRKI